MKTPPGRKRLIWITLGTLALAGLLYGAYRFYMTTRTLAATREQLATTTQTFQNIVASLNENLSLSEHEKQELNDALQSTQSNAENLQQKADELATNYEKLSSLDPELLQKYSKVYFLSENYVPSSLVTLADSYVSGAGRKLQFHEQAWPFLQQMMDDANGTGLGLLVTSAYRSFGTQAALKAQYKVTYGAGTANSFSADQGYSEHQLGTTIDFTTKKTGDLSTTFDVTAESKWLVENAYKYGFVLSYPKGNKYYVYEPWHWRFVGINLATKLHDDNKHLYELDQRDIDSYLISIFDH